MMMDESAPANKRRRLIRFSKMCSLENRLWLLKNAGKPTPKMIKRWSRITTTAVNNNPTNERGSLRERDVVSIGKYVSKFIVSVSK